MTAQSAPERAADRGLDLAEQRRQLGRVVIQHDTATAAPMRGMAAAFHRQEAAPEPGEPIPPGWHVAYFLPSTPARELNADGTPRDNGVLPAMPLPRRMHAGSTIRFVSPILVGDALRRENSFSGIEARVGSSGPLIVSKQTRRIFSPRGLAIEEEFTQVHLPLADKDASAAPRRDDPPPLDADWERTIAPDAIDLFRYSALTFNPHRIHYDRTYATAVEGFEGLVVHGMFTAQCLIDLARDRLPGLRFAEFSFRARGPLFEGRPMRLRGRHLPDERRIDLSAVSLTGALSTLATIRHE